MTKPIIEVKNLSKEYIISHDIQPYYSLRDSLAQLAKRPFEYFFSKNYSSKKEKFLALNDVNFSVMPGEVVGIIGKNGAGKSTLLKILSQITPPTKGSVHLRGRVASLLEVGTGFHPELTGRENIFLNGAILGMTQKEIKSKFDEIVAFAGIEKFLDTPVKRYSSGMYVRLAFAVAAHLEPEILIVDEVLSVGDAEFQKKCLGKMDDISKKDGRTVLFVSHNMQAIRQLCKRAILLKNGVVVCDDDVDITLNNYQYSYENIDISNSPKIVYNENRRGSGHIKFTSVSLHDINKNICYSFRMGEQIYFSFQFEVLEDVKGIDICIVLHSESSKEIITSVRKSITNEIIHADTKGQFSVMLEDVNLRPGEYPLYFQISENGYSSQKYEVIDDITLPLRVSLNDELDIYDFNTLAPTGFFSIAKSLVTDFEIYK